MARKVEIADEERLEAKKRRKILESGWTTEDTSKTQDSSNSTDEHRLKVTAETEDLYASIPGRRSFGGFNKVVERYYEHAMDTQKFGLNNEDIEGENMNDDEMVDRYSSLIGLPHSEK